MLTDELYIRQEQPSDYDGVARTVEDAFAAVPYSDHSEHFLVERLRASELFIPELSLVAVHQGRIVGHSLLTRINIINKQKQHTGLSLAPISVDPSMQKQGVGKRLMEASHMIAQQMGFDWIVLIGHEDYYPRFGYEQAQKYGISFSIEAPPENCMIKPLNHNALDQIHGLVQYPEVYFD